MPQVKTYRPGTKKVTATATVINNGKSYTASTDTLSNWNRLIIFGLIEGASGTNLPNAGVRVYQLASTGVSLTSTNLIATVFTDAQGEYGISLQTLSSPAVYAFEAFAPGN